MAQTVLKLDVTRRELSEGRFTLTKHFRDIQTPAQNNNLFQWPATGSYTLQPINLTTDFIETSHWEPLKFRLSDCVYDPGWFTEVPNNTIDDVSPAGCDFFMHGVVKNTNYTPGKNQLHNLFGLLDVVAINAINFENPNTVWCIASKNDLPPNQAYMLRFAFDGTPNTTRAGVLDFKFGDFMLRLNSDGVAQVWQSTDFVNYGYVYSFVYAFYGQIHGHSHQIVIFPHCRNRIEFLCSTKQRFQTLHRRWNFIIGTGNDQCYTIPGKIAFQPDGVTPLITQKGKWSIAFSREFRPMFQVSRLAFANGTNPQASLWDSPVDITMRTGVVYPPNAELSASVEVDSNGGTGQWMLRNPDTGVEFASDGKSSRVQFAIGMQGIGDIPGPGLGSSITPEIYNYTIDKPPVFTTIERTPYNAAVSDVSLDHGDSPESEKLSVTTYDRGAYSQFSERGDIPLELWDTTDNLLLFEGTAFEVEAGEARAHTPEGLNIEAYGMVDNLLRMEWCDTAPNFEIDPKDEQHRPYVIPEAIRVCFEAAGVPREQVIIEEEDVYLKDFRFWSGPSAPDAGGLGGGHSDGALEQKRWLPQPNLPVYEFTDHLIRKILGWHWVRDKTDHCWHIYKRPDPNLKADAPKMVPKVEFYSDGHPRSDTVDAKGNRIPAYKHSNLKKKLKRPFCTTIIVPFMMDTLSDLDRGALTIILAATAGGSSPDDPVFHQGQKSAFMPFTNYDGYINALNPDGDVSHPDFLGRQRIHILNTPEICDRESAAWIGRRLFEDNCFGYLYRTFDADWGDVNTYNLRKWDMVLVNGEKHYIHRIEPRWGEAADKSRRAHYTVSKYRDNARPPR